MTTSVQFTQHALALSDLSPEAAEECRRSVSRSVSRSGSSSEVVRFHYEVGVVEPKSGALHLIQVCCQVCVEGQGCCKASVCCDAVCCQLQLPKGPQGPKCLTEEEGEGGADSRTIELPRTVAASASSHAGLASYPITTRELMAHVAKCCDLCLESKGAACCKKDCCAVSCCLVNVEVMGAAVVTPALDKPSCCTTSIEKPAKVSVVCRTKNGACCADPAPAPLANKKPISGSDSDSTCCTKNVVGSSSSHGAGHAEEIKGNSCCADKASPRPSIDSSDGHKPPASKCCTGEKVEISASSVKTFGSKDGNAREDKPALLIASCASSKCCTGNADEDERKSTTIASCGVKMAGVVEPYKPSCASTLKKPCSSATQCCESKVDEPSVLLAITPSATGVKTPRGGGVAAKGCCTTDASTTNKTCGPKKDACAPVDKSRAVQPVDVRWNY